MKTEALKSINSCQRRLRGCQKKDWGEVLKTSFPWSQPLLRGYSMVVKQEPKCEYDQKLKTMVHKFPIGATVCCCGSMSVEKTKTYGGWRQLHDKGQNK